MTIQFKEDPDLMFLQFCEENELKLLCSYLTHDPNDGKQRISCELLNDKRYKILDGDPEQHRKCWHLIAAELQLYGGDTLINNTIRRGKGVLYREILCDVLDANKIKHNKAESIHELEKLLLEKISSDIIKQMSPEDRAVFDVQYATSPNAAASICLDGVHYNPAALWAIISIFVRELASKYFGQGAAYAAMAAIGRQAAAFVVPIAVILAALTTVPLITGPAKRITSGACVLIAWLRNKRINNNMF